MSLTAQSFSLPARHLLVRSGVLPVDYTLSRGTVGPYFLSLTGVVLIGLDRLIISSPRHSSARDQLELTAGLPRGVP